MSTEVVMDEATTETPAAIVADPPHVNGTAEVEADPDPAKPRPTRLTRTASNMRETRARSIANGVADPIRQLRTAADRTLKEIIEGLGRSVPFKIEIYRLEPEDVFDPLVNKRIPCEGHIKTISEEISEDDLAKRYGGGKYELKFKRDDGTGKFVYAAQKTLKIAGEPNLESIPRSSPAAQHTAAPTQGPHQESPAVVNRAMDIMAAQLERANDRSERQLPAGPDPSTQLMLQMLQETIAKQSSEMSEMRRDLMTARTAKPPEDTFKDKFLDKLMDGDSARLQGVRMQYESELKQVKEHAVENERRLYTMFQVEKSAMDTRFERDLMMVKQQYENQIVTIRQSNEISLQAARSSFETSAKLADAENRRLERDNADLRVEVKELRAKKDKSIIETMKEVEAVRDAIGGDDNEPKGALATLAEAAVNPEAWATIGAIFGKKEDPAAAAALAAQQQHQLQGQGRAQIYRGPNGQKFKIENGELVPVKKLKKKQAKPTAPPTVEGAEAEAAAEATEGEAPAEAEEAEEAEEAGMPELAEDERIMLVKLLESACGAQDPAIVAQGLRSRMPQQALIFLGDKAAEIGIPQTVNLFLTKVAKVTANSPLMTQDGRNWTRALARALVGEAS